VQSQRLSASSLVALLDVAPMLGLCPLLSCYCLALLAELQQTESKSAKSAALHGARQLKALCTIFTRLSTWYQQARLLGP